jgi:hypothetical protein
MLVVYLDPRLYSSRCWVVPQDLPVVRTDPHAGPGQAVEVMADELDPNLPGDDGNDDQDDEELRLIRKSTVSRQAAAPGAA